MRTIESWSATDRRPARGTCACPGCSRPADEWLGCGIWCAACGLDRMLREPDRFCEGETRELSVLH